MVDKHGPAVWRTAYRLLGNDADAADCFQETFVCALEVSRRQRVRNFPALLVRVAASRAVNRLRRRVCQSRHSVAALELDAVASSNPGPAHQAQEHELVARLREALGRLPAQEAEVFCLRYLNDMSYRQIAKQLGITTSAAGVLLHRARTRLRELLEGVIV
jgi:RNA polymerase sigma-70 factor (ECF subfamily)